MIGLRVQLHGKYRGVLGILIDHRTHSKIMTFSGPIEGRTHPLIFLSRHLEPQSANEALKVLEQRLVQNKICSRQT